MTSALVTHVQQSISNADQGISKLTPEVLALPGMSSARVRHFLNNVCSLPHLNYLEIGCWKGSTLVSALYGNQKTVHEAIAIDNWALHPQEPIKDIFLATVHTYLDGYPLRYIEQDCFTINVTNTFKNPINVYFYDANHNARSHEKAFTHFNTAFADTFITTVDDWNWDRVQHGTRSAFEKLRYTIMYEREFLTAGNDPNDWYNGLYIAVISKKPAH